jgi:hypothetical protein
LHRATRLGPDTNDATPLTDPTSWAARKACRDAGSGRSGQAPGRLPRSFLLPIYERRGKTRSTTLVAAISPTREGLRASGWGYAGSQPSLCAHKSKRHPRRHRRPIDYLSLFSGSPAMVYLFGARRLSQQISFFFAEPRPKRCPPVYTDTEATLFTLRWIPVLCERISYVRTKRGTFCVHKTPIYLSDVLWPLLG